MEPIELPEKWIALMSEILWMEAELAQAMLCGDVEAILKLDDMLEEIAPLGE